MDVQRIKDLAGNKLEFLSFYITGVTPATLNKMIDDTDAELTAAVVPKLCNVSLLAMATNRTLVDDYLQKAGNAGVSSYVHTHMFIQNHVNFAALNLLGHLLLAGGVRSTSNFISEFRRKLGGLSIWHASIAKSDLSTKQKDILEEKTKRLPAAQVIPIAIEIVQKLARKMIRPAPAVDDDDNDDNNGDSDDNEEADVNETPAAEENVEDPLDDIETTPDPVKKPAEDTIRKLASERRRKAADDKRSGDSKGKSVKRSAETTPSHVMSRETAEEVIARNKREAAEEARSKSAKRTASVVIKSPDRKSGKSPVKKPVEPAAEVIVAAADRKLPRGAAATKGRGGRNKPKSRSDTRAVTKEKTDIASSSKSADGPGAKKRKPEETAPDTGRVTRSSNKKPKGPNE